MSSIESNLAVSKLQRSMQYSAPGRGVRAWKKSSPLLQARHVHSTFTSSQREVPREITSLQTTGPYSCDYFVDTAAKLLVLAGRPRSINRVLYTIDYRQRQCIYSCLLGSGSVPRRKVSEGLCTVPRREPPHAWSFSATG